MQISLKWVNELVNIESVNLDDLIEKLTLGGFEVEEVIEIETEKEKEIALDISATANRSDSLSLQGISKEIATLFDKPINKSNYLIDYLDWKKEIENKSRPLSDKEYCSLFIAMTVTNLTNITVPKWLKQKLISSGVKPVNNLLDFQNYILLETGYPFEFYDLENIYSELNDSKFNLVIENASNQDKFLAANENIYQLDSSISVIKTNGIPISIAGIIPNKQFSYSTNTKTLLIEGSIFNSTEIRRKSRKLSLRTERSARYEKSLKNTNLLESFYKLLLLLRISNPDLHVTIHTFSQFIEEEVKPISLNYKTIKEILGPITNELKKDFTFISPNQITNYLNRLDFKYIYNETDLIWDVSIPYERSDDITREIDLVEEIGRLHGFNQFLIRLPKIKTIGKEDYSYQTRKKIISSFLNLGFNELIHYSLVNETTVTKNKIKLVNPLIEDYSHLRVTLLPSLIKTVQENLKQGNKLIEGFEFGHVFLGDNLENLKEKEYIAGIFGGIETKLTWSNDSIPISWFEAKGKIEQFQFGKITLL
jgi:phenylalanyl-tRNA synthetase beta chain